MPFISKDWRSPGEAWVKTNEGWERLKVLECSKRQCLSSQNSMDDGDADDDNEENVSTSTSASQQQAPPPPHCHITIRCTREIAGFNGLGEAVRRLDFRSSVRDRRRFHYICDLLQLLVSHKGIANLSGSAQRQMLQMVAEVASQVSDSQQHINTLRNLVMQLQNIVCQENQKCWGKPLGSTNLWQEHVETIKRIQNVANQIKIKEPGPDIRPKIHDMPVECVREIILRIADHRDLEAAANAWNLMSALVSEQRIWRELTLFHFNQRQLNSILELNNVQRMSDVKDWKKVYHQVRRTYGLSEDYKFAEVLLLCRLCCCLFWPSAGHPCIMDQSPDYKQRLEAASGQMVLSEPVLPAQFLKFFSL